jgi:hypothetical protein
LHTVKEAHFPFLFPENIRLTWNSNISRRHINSNLLTVKVYLLPALLRQIWKYPESSLPFLQGFWNKRTQFLLN